MNIWVACVCAEYAKLKRTLARGLAIAAPVCAVLLSLFVLANLDAIAASKAVPRWQAYLDPLLRMWAGFLLPIMVTLQAVLIAQLEHANRQWKYLLALPISRTSLYAAKSVNLFWLVLLGHVALWFLALVACAAFGLAQGALDEVSWFLAGKLSATLVGGLVLAAVQLLLSIRMDSYIGAIGVGLVATMVALFGAGAMGKAAGYFPWSMPLHALQQSFGVWHVSAVLAALLVTALGARVLRGMQVR